MPGSVGFPEILVILVIALVVFGPNRLPEIGRQVGRGVREFRRFQEHLRFELDDVLAADAEEGPTDTTESAAELEGPQDHEDAPPSEPATKTTPTPPITPAGMPQAMPSRFRAPRPPK